MRYVSSQTLTIENVRVDIEKIVDAKKKYHTIYEVKSGQVFIYYASSCCMPFHPTGAE
jgi:hypothetical protein